MKLVELTGPTGSGKSAIYAELMKLGGFVPNPTAKEAEEAIEDVIRWQEQADFLAFLGWVFRTAVSHDGRLAKRESGTLRALCKFYLAQKYPQDPRYMIVDGGLVHRGQGIDLIRPKMPTHRYFELMPLPDTVFAVWCQPEILAERNRARGGSHDRSADLERQWQCHNLGMDILKRRGAKVISVDTSTLTPKKAAEAIIHRLGIARKYDGDHAEGYDADRQQQAKHHAEQAIIERWLEEFPAGSWVLDAPCGTGRFVECCERKGFVVRGLDAEPDMIAKAGKKVKNPTAMVGDVAQWRFIHGDVRDTKLPDKSVDVAVNCRITRWLWSKHGVKGIHDLLREMQRVARKAIILTARVRNHDFAIPYEVINGALAGWRITRDEAGAAGRADAPVTDPDYRVIMLEPV